MPVSTGRTFAQLWDEAVAEHAEAVFLVFEDAGGDVAHWSYGRFDEIVSATAATLAAQGLGRGDALHLYLGNCPAFVAAWLAAARLGAWIVPADPRASAAELGEQVRRTRARHAVVAAARRDVYDAAAGRPGVTVTCVDGSARDLGPDGPLTRVGSDWPRPPAPGPRDRLAVMFTSGTTAAPKGVVLTQALYAHTGQTMARAAGLEPRHRWFVTLPLFHANAQYYCFGSAVAAGASVALAAAFSASGWFAQAARLAVTHGSLFAAPIRMILARDPGGPDLALTHLWFAQNLAPEEYSAFARRIGCLPRQLYGMTETGPAVLTDRADPPDPPTIGTETGGSRVRTVEATEPDGGTGLELEVGGVPGYTLFDGYLDDPATTAAAMSGPDGDGLCWFRTGDRVTRRADGRYVFVGRGGDIVKVGGENVSLTEVDAVLAEYPGLEDVVAVAVPDPVLDEVVAAVVVARDEFDEAGFLAWSARRLAPARCPRSVRRVAELPRTSVGKIRRYLARRLVTDAVAGRAPVRDLS